MRNRTYGGVRGRKTKVGRKLLRFPPTQFVMCFIFSCYRCAVLLDVNLFELYLHPRQEL